MQCVTAQAPSKHYDMTTYTPKWKKFPSNILYLTYDARKVNCLWGLLSSIQIMSHMLLEDINVIIWLLRALHNELKKVDYLWREKPDTIKNVACVTQVQESFYPAHDESLNWNLFDEIITKTWKHSENKTYPDTVSIRHVRHWGDNSQQHPLLTVKQWAKHHIHKTNKSIVGGFMQIYRLNIRVLMFNLACQGCGQCTEEGGLHCFSQLGHVKLMFKYKTGNRLCLLTSSQESRHCFKEQ